MAALGRPGYINLDRSSIFGTDSRTLEKMQTQANLVLDELFQTEEIQPWVDCARSYGLSEKFVGEYLRNNNISPEKVYVSSKWGYSELFYHFGMVKIGDSVERLMSQPDGSIFPNFLRFEKQKYDGDFPTLRYLRTVLK